MTDRYDRLNRHIDDLLKNRAPRPFLAEDDEERAVLQMAAQLRLLRPDAPAPRQRFRARMRRLLGAINPHPGLPRRRLLVGGTAAALAGIAAGLGGAVGVRRLAPAGYSASAQRVAASNLAGWAKVGRLQDVPQGGALSFTTAAGLSGYVMRDGDQLSALSAICNHLGCHVQWQPASKQFICPCDEAQFDSTGVYLAEDYAAGPPVALKPLTRLAVRAEGDLLYVQPV
ncbi:MAG: ubiquinol-cytochrome c reductase iron-sulfur subunit [Chloroflexota bacterium]|jgi:Rieske Fe-S protein